MTKDAAIMAKEMDMEEETGLILKVNWPEPKYKLILVPDFELHLPKKPNLFWRYWQRVFLGWRWEPLIDKKPELINAS